MRIFIAAAAILLVAATGPANATALLNYTPQIQLFVSGSPVNTSGLSVSYNSLTQQGTIAGTLSTQSWTAVINVVTNPDPTVNYSITVTNTTNAVLPFTFSFSTPVIAALYNKLTNEFSGTMTDTRGDGVELSSIQQQALLDSVSVPAVQLGPSTCVNTGGIPSATYPCPNGPGFGPLTAAVPVATYGTLGVNLSFSLTAFDSASFSGDATLDETPEPDAAVLTGCGLLALAGVLRRRA